MTPQAHHDLRDFDFLVFAFFIVCAITLIKLLVEVKDIAREHEKPPVAVERTTK